MTGIRSVRSSEGKFTQISNVVALDKRLSARAKGLVLCALAQKPDTLHSAESLAEQNKEGRDAVATALQELTFYGYYKTVKRQRKGKWITETFISDDVITEEVLPQVEPETGFQGPARPGKTTFPQVAPEPDFQGSAPPGETQQSPGRAGNGFSGPGATRQNDVSAGRTGTGFSGDVFNTELLPQHEKIKDGNNSSSVVTVEDHAHEERSKEEEEKSSTKKNHKDFPLELKTYVAGLEYYGKKPTPEQYRQIAALVEPLLDAGADAGELKRQLQADTGRGVHSIVGLYLSKLKKMRPEDLQPSQKSPKPARKSSPKWEAQMEEKIAQHRFEAPWCGECDEKTRIQEVATGFMGTRKRLCPTCGSKKPATANA